MEGRIGGRKAHCFQSLLSAFPSGGFDGRAQITGPVFMCYLPLKGLFFSLQVDPKKTRFCNLRKLVTLPATGNPE